jgi:hypothetical protein
MKILIAGSNAKAMTASYCRWYGVPKLYSFLSEKGLIENWDDTFSLMVDSGAHSWNKETITKVGMTKRKKIQPAAEFIEKYFQFIKENCHKKLVFVEFDVYGHLTIEEIDEFYRRVMALNPVAKFIRVYHPMLDGGSLSMLKKWIDEGHDYIGVGNDSTDLLDKIFSITRDKVKIHGFAMTKIHLMEYYPFFSVDSTSPLATVIFGHYIQPLMNKLSREDVHRLKSIECFHDDYARLERAVVETSITQDYITNLWTLKGVTWNELTW